MGAATRHRRVRAAGDGGPRLRRAEAPCGRPRAEDGRAWASIISRSRVLPAPGAPLVLLFILVHKIGDTLGQLVLRLLLNDMG
jgi:PAT family beta-lactamase induction signal transducer AmpG